MSPRLYLEVLLLPSLDRLRGVLADGPGGGGQLEQHLVRGEGLQCWDYTQTQLHILPQGPCRARASYIY